MPLVWRFLSAFSRPMTRRFATKASRFQFAIVAGLVLTAVAFLTITVDEHKGLAEGFLDSLFGGGAQPNYVHTQYVSAGPAAAGPRRHVAHRHTAGRLKSVRFRKGHEQKGADHNGGDHNVGDQNGARAIHASAGSQSICVRTCDGFAFPVGAYHGPSDVASHEATCHSECPGAATSLYVLPPNADTITDAVSVHSGRNYSSLPDAFHYTTVLDQACSCHPASGGKIKSLLHDFTLRRGDAVMTHRGFQIFHGAPHYPFQRKDFVALNRSPDVSNDTRATYKAIERASLVRSSLVVAQRTEPSQVPTRAWIKKAGTKDLEHQASR